MPHRDDEGFEAKLNNLGIRIQRLYAEFREFVKLAKEENHISREHSDTLHQYINNIEAQEKRCRALGMEIDANRNEKMRTAFLQTKEIVEKLREEVEKLSAPPNTHGVFSAANEDGTVTIYTGGRKMKVNLHPSIKADDLQKGQELVLNELSNVMEALGFDGRGEVVAVKSRIDEHRVQIVVRNDDEQIAEIADSLKGVVLKEGDLLLFDSRSGFVLEKLPKSETNDLLLEEISSETTYDRIGGMQRQIEVIQDAIELPYLYAEHFREHKLKAPKGVLLYGPPGCGKTLLGKAVAASLAHRAAQITGREVRAYFFNIKGPELLDKYVGETERKIREIFARARELAREGHLVVIFWDEIESILRTRGVGISSDIESTIVPQFLSEIDGVEELQIVVVIGASNRQDLIDPAVLRPGRFDVKVQIERPDPLAAVDILLKYIVRDLPLDPDFALRGKAYETPNRLQTLYPVSWAKINESLSQFFTAHPIRESIGQRFDSVNQRDLAWERWDLSTVENLLCYCAVRAVEDIYIETDGKQEWKDRQGRVVPFSDTSLLEAILAAGTKEILYVKDFVSGALLENIVNRAKKLAIKRLIAGGKKGITTMDFHLAVQEETNQMEDLPNTTDPNTWGKIQGRFKDRIVNLRTVRSNTVVTARKVVSITTGHYL